MTKNYQYDKILKSIEKKDGLWYNINKCISCFERNVNMSPKSIKEGCLLYHQTKLNNLKSIIKYGLLSRAIITSQDLHFEDVADSQIIEERIENGLDVYVPFHFHPRTTFDYKIRYNNPNESFIFLCMYRDRAANKNALILPAHPLSNMKPQTYPYAEGINVIDWSTMELTQGNIGYNSQVRMAECLIKDKVDISDISIIYAKDETDKCNVERILQQNDVYHIKVYIGNTFFGSPSNLITF